MRNRFEDSKTALILLSAFAVTILIIFFLINKGIIGSKSIGIAIWSGQKKEAMIIPKPVKYIAKSGNYTLTDSSSIYVSGKNDAETDEIYKIGKYLADFLNPSTGYNLSVIKSSAPTGGNIYLTTLGGDSDLGNEGYQLETTEEGVRLTAFTAEGLFRGIQTIRQMLPAEVEKRTVVSGIPWTMACSSITDYPAYPWRGMMLDVARHFFDVEDVKRTIDLIAQYKINRFHLHLTDDQGWRIEIKSWPDLTKIGGSTEVGGGKGGFYTQEEYIDIVNYANERYITVIPEIDMPGHCNAALASYGELNPDGKKKELYTGTKVGFSTLMCREEITYTFIDDVIGELSAITPGEYLHIGGDEASSTSKEDYDYFIGRVNEIVKEHGKKAIGWNPFESSPGTPSDALLQNWNAGVTAAVNKNMKIIMSPPQKAYLDMKYYEDTPIGLDWAGLTSTDDAYQWDPTDYVPKTSAIGMECALWTETIATMNEIEYLTFPRLPGHAEIGWTPEDLRNWNEYKIRLSSQGPRMDYQKINYFKDPVVPW